MGNEPIPFNRLVKARQKEIVVKSSITVCKDREDLQRILISYGIEPKLLSLYLERNIIADQRVNKIGFQHVDKSVTERDKLTDMSALKFFSLLGGEVRNG